MKAIHNKILLVGKREKAPQCLLHARRVVASTFSFSTFAAAAVAEDTRDYVEDPRTYFKDPGNEYLEEARSQKVDAQRVPT